MDVRKTYLRALILKAVRNSFVGDTGMFRQKRGSALSISFFRLSSPIGEVPADDVACLLNRISMANEIR